MPDPEAGPLDLARHYLAIHQPGRALAALDAGPVDLEDVEPWRIRGEALCDLERGGEAASAATSGLRIDPDDIGLLSILCRAETQNGNAAAAERAVLAALRLEPEHPELLVQYAHLVARAGQLDKAQRLVDEAAKIDPMSEAVVSTRGFLAFLEGRDDEAQHHAQTVLRDDPDAAHAHALRAATLVEEGRMREARRHLEAAARADPTDHHLAEAARSVRASTNPLLWPMIPIMRWGQGRVWLAYICIFAVTLATGIGWLSGAVVVTWLVFVVYSWTVPSLVSWWYGRTR